MPLRVLHIEDDRNDAELVRAALETDGLEVEIHLVDTPGGFGAALESGAPDVILSDFALPLFDGFSALRMTRARYPEVPFIIVSGTLGEEAAVESVRHGATDYILKQRLARLGTSVRRALAERDERKKRRMAEEALHVSEEQLRHAQKMEAIGRLAGGVAHDFNNILTAIIGHTELAQEHVGVNAAARRSLQEIAAAAQRAASLTRQLLAFSRRQVLNPRPLDLNAVVREMEDMLRRLIGADIDLRIQLDTAIGTVQADPTQIEQILLNLVVNARDAMPDGGVLTIATGDREGAQAAGDLNATLHDRYTTLTVSDTGCGMDEATRSRIFEPFFTTKGLGKGTGLGLAMVHGIVQQSGGIVDVLSRPGEGAAFTVLLPTVEERPHPKPQVEETEPSGSGTETVLVIEDNDLVRELVSQTLKTAGYTVIEAPTRDKAVEACELSRQQGIRIALMLSDVVMPGMSRSAMMEHLDRSQPGMKRLYMSGYFEQSSGGDSASEVGDAFIQKPFTISQLLQKVRAVLDERTGAKTQHS